MMEIVSGGQTGADRAALDAALERGIPCGGWCPRGRLAEDGPIPPRYPLRETDSDNYAERTEANVRDSDGTLVLSRGTPAGGTLLTCRLARRHGKPFLVIDASRTSARRAVKDIRHWLEIWKIERLNVAGPRASHQPQIYRFTLNCLRLLFDRLEQAD